MRIQLLPVAYKARVVEKYERLIEDFVTDEHARGRFRSVIEQLMARDESADLPRFFAHTERLDRARRESYIQVFPELRDLLGSTL